MYSYDQVRRTTGQPCLSAIVRGRRFSLFGHCENAIQNRCQDLKTVVPIKLHYLEWLEPLAWTVGMLRKFTVIGGCSIVRWFNFRKSVSLSGLELGLGLAIGLGLRLGLAVELSDFWTIEPSDFRHNPVIILLKSSYGLVLSLVRRFRGAFALTKIILITFIVKQFIRHCIKLGRDLNC